MLIKTGTAGGSLWIPRLIPKQIPRSVCGSPKGVREQGLWGAQPFPQDLCKNPCWIVPQFPYFWPCQLEEPIARDAWRQPHVWKTLWDGIFTAETGQKLSSFLQKEQTLSLMKVLMQIKCHSRGETQAPLPPNTCSPRASITNKITL